METLIKKLLIAIGIFAGLIVAGILALIRPDIPPELLMDRYAGPESEFFSFDGMKVHYRDEGTGPAILLVHGTFGSLHTFDEWTGALKDSLRIIRVDLPGFGLTGPHPEHDYSLAATLWLMDSLRAQLGVERWSVGGNSLGGRLAWEYALRFPDRTEKVVLIDAAGSPVPPPVQPDSVRPVRSSNRALPFRLARIPVLQQLLTVCTPKFWYRATLKQVYGDPARITDETVQRYYELLRRKGNRRAFIERGRAASPRRSAVPEPPSPVAAADLGRPVLIQWGELDRWIPVANGRRFEEAVPGARMIVYPHAGHVPMEEIPEITARDARRFLLQGL